MTRDQVIALVVAKAREHHLVPLEFLGGIIAEGLDVRASRPARQEDWRRYWEPPEPRFDVSFGLGQKNARFSAEYAAWCAERGIPFALGGPADAYPGDGVIAMIRDAYFDPAHALDVAAAEYRRWRYDPDVDPLHAWSAYNGPAYYRGWTRDDGAVVTWRDNPNVPNYAAGLAEARRILGAAAVPTLTYHPDAPVDIQPDDWSCSEQSAQWLLRAIGRDPKDPWIRGKLLNRGIVTREHGLMDASGATLARWLQEQYGDEMGLRFTAKNGATWEDLVAIVGRQPVMIGGRAWNHWSGVRRLKDGGLELANPSPNWKDVGTLLDRAEFDRWGSWSYITVSDGASAPVQPPAPPTDDRDATIVRLRAELETVTRQRDGLVNAVAYLGDDVGDRIQAALAELRRVRAESVGARP